MAHNVSPRKRRERLLDSPAEQWRSNDLMIVCNRCGRGRMMKVRDIPFRQGARLGSVVCRFRCSRCQPGSTQAFLFAASPQDGMRVAFVLY